MCVNASLWTKSKFMGLSVGAVFVGTGRTTPCNDVQYSAMQSFQHCVRQDCIAYYCTVQENSTVQSFQYCVR